MGHVKRCIVLAKNLQKKKVSCFFIIQFKEIKELLESKGFEVIVIQQKNELGQIKKILSEKKCNKLIIDSKRKSIEKLVKNLDKKIITILIDNEHYCNFVDLIVLSSIKNPKKNYPKNCIVGIEYLLHGIEELPKPIKNNSNSILLSLGGSDKFNITKKIVKSFSNIDDDFNLVIVLGKFYSDEKNLLKIIKNDERFSLVRSPSSLTALMEEASVGLISFGITVYESAICKLPSFVVSHSKENDESSKSVEKYGWISYLGKYDQIDYANLPTTVLDLMKNNKKLENMIESCLKIDGLGPSRVANYIFNLK